MPSTSYLLIPERIRRLGRLLNKINCAKSMILCLNSFLTSSLTTSDVVYYVNSPILKLAL